VRRNELAIEQGESARAQPHNKVRQRDFRRIGRPAEHRFAEKGAAEPDAVKPTDQFSVFPCLDAVRVAAGVEQCDRCLDLAIDPG